MLLEESFHLVSVLSIYVSYFIVINFEKIFHLGFSLCNGKTTLQHAILALWLLWSCQNSLKVKIYVTKVAKKLSH